MMMYCFILEWVRIAHFGDVGNRLTQGQLSQMAEPEVVIVFRWGDRRPLSWTISAFNPSRNWYEERSSVCSRGRAIYNALTMVLIGGGRLYCILNFGSLR